MNKRKRKAGTILLPFLALLILVMSAELLLKRTAFEYAKISNTITSFMKQSEKMWHDIAEGDKSSNEGYSLDYISLEPLKKKITHFKSKTSSPSFDFHNLIKELIQCNDESVFSSKLSTNHKPIGFALHQCTFDDLILDGTNAYKGNVEIKNLTASEASYPSLLLATGSTSIKNIILNGTVIIASNGNIEIEEASSKVDKSRLILISLRDTIKLKRSSPQVTLQVQSNSPSELPRNGIIDNSAIPLPVIEYLILGATRGY